jgi:serine/threonine-protein kinase
MEGRPQTPSGTGLRHWFDLACGFEPDEWRERLAEAGADEQVIADIESLFAADGVTGDRVRAPVTQLLETLPETELAIGDTVGAWRLLRRLGGGGMGAVFLVERADGHFRQCAAIKLVRGLPGATTLLQFARERQILAGLQHPHIAGLLDGGATPGGHPYLVMEYVEGVPIDVYCRENRLDLGARLDLFRTVLGAVQFAHRHLIVHCDLKPSNVLVGTDGTPVLLDFGIARALDRVASRHRAAQEAGYFTPRYASPEQRRGESVTTASDIYALGLILFELVTDRKAQTDADDNTIEHLGRAVVRPSELAADTPWRHRIRGDLDAIVLCASAADPGARYVSAESMSQDIKAFLRRYPVEARRQGFVYRGSRLVRRNWPVFTVGTATLVLALVFGWQMIAERNVARRAEHQAQLQAATAQRVSDFVVSVFDSANPASNGGRHDVSARDLLDDAAARIDRELANEPQVKARMLDTLGTAYRYIGQPKAAIDLLGQAARLYAASSVGQPLAAAAALSQVAVLYANNNYPHELAERTVERMSALRRPLVAEDSDEHADTLNTNGIVLNAEGRYDEAEQSLQRALAIRRLRDGPTSIHVASVLHNLGLVMLDRGAAREAIPLLEQALSIKRSHDTEGTARYESTLLLLARAVAASGDREKGLQLFAQHLALCRKIYGNEGTALAGAYNESASALQDAGLYDQAETYYRQALAIDGKASGTDSANYAIALNNLGSLMEDRGDYAAAEKLFRQSLDLRRKLYGEDDLGVARAEHNLGRLLVEAGRLDQAGALLAKAAATRKANLPPDHVDLAKTDLWLAEIAVRRNDVAGARAALARFDASTARLTPLMSARRDVMGARLDADAHEDDKALARRRGAWETMRKAVGANHPATAEFALGYARALAAAGRASEARDIVKPLLAVADRVFAADAPVRTGLARLR